MSVESVKLQTGKGFFEIFGYDFIIDADYEPWLIEVNASPSLSTTTESDRKLKMSVMESVFQIVIPPEWFDENSKHGTNMSKEYQVGSFNLIIDESQNNAEGPGGKMGANAKKAAAGTLWR